MRIGNIAPFLKNFCYLLLGFSILFNQVVANELSDKLYINGFFTADLTVTDKQLSLISNADQLLEYQDNNASLKNSLIGAQIEYQFANNWHAVVQGKLYANTDNDVTGNIDWSYLAYDFGDDLSARIGKFKTPFLQGIELQNISYSRLWARPLIPSSGAGGFNEFTGVELLKHISVGEGNWDFQLSLGKPEHGLNQIDGDNIKSISVRYQENDAWIRSSLLHTEYSVYTKDGIQITDSGEALMASIEAEFPVSALLFNVGYSTSDADITPNDTAYYFSVAYPLENITPFVYASRSNQDFDAFNIPPPSPPPGAPERGERTAPPPTQSLDGNDDIYSYAVGLRYNISERYAFKIQAEHIHSRHNTERATNAPPGDGNALSLVIEGVF